MKYNSSEIIDLISNLTKNWINYYVFENEEFQELLHKVVGRTLVTPDRLCILYQLLKQYENYAAAELGVSGGGTAFFIASIIKMQIYLYDTFEGLPEVSEFDQFSKGEFAVSFKDVQTFLKDFENVNYFKGVFPETASDLEQGLGLVHLDCDIYDSMKSGLEYFYPRMISHGTILIDDYGCNQTLGVKKAVDDFMLNKSDLFLSLATGQAMIIKR